jgi:ribosomal protein L29
MAKKIELTKKNPTELTEMLNKQREELRTLRFSSVGGRIQDSSAPKKTRKQIARILTELHVRTSTEEAVVTPTA